MSDAQKIPSKKLGAVIDLKGATSVVRPDGSVIITDGGSYVLDVPGIHSYGDNSVEAK